MADINKELHEYLLKNKNDDQCEIFMESEEDSLEIKRLYVMMCKNAEEQKANEPLIEKCFSSMTRKQRIVACALCSISGFFCLLLSMFYLPFLLIYENKFVILYSVGSALMLFSLLFLWGPTNYLESIFSPKRRYYSISYMATIIATLYCTIHLKSALLTLLCCILEFVAMISFFVSSLPGGIASLLFFSKICSRMFCRMFKSSAGSTLSI